MLFFNFSKIVSVFILLGIPTKPSSSCSGIISITLSFFVCNDAAWEPIFFREFTISSLKSISTVSTTFIIFSSVTLRPLINLDSIFCLDNSLFILGPPPCTTTTCKPSLLSTLKSLIKLSKIFLSMNTLPPYFITIISFLYFSTYFKTSSTGGPSVGKIFFKSIIERFSQ